MNWLIVAGAFGFLVLLSFVPLWFDPYYHKEMVDFWVWANRELYELFREEKE